MVLRCQAETFAAHRYCSARHPEASANFDRDVLKVFNA